MKRASRRTSGNFLFARTLLAVMVLAVAAYASGPALAQPSCVAPDASGTVVLPAPGCGYLSPTDVHVIINGLPPGTTIKVGVEHSRFFNVTSTPGGSLGGDKENYQSFLTLNLQGTGGLSGYSRMVTMGPVAGEAHTAPRTPGATVQSFNNDMFALQGQLPPGDPDFDLLRITAGSAFGMPSPGHTTLTRLPGGNWNVDSFFDITYRIDFVGAPGGPFSGMSGSTTGTIRMQSGTPPPPQCVVADNGSGTVTLPPAGCGYVGPGELHMMINGLPAGTTIEVAAEHKSFFCPGSAIGSVCSFSPPPGSHDCDQPGGSLGGEQECAGSSLELNLKGTGSLAGYNRTLVVPHTFETHTGPRIPGQSVQSFDTSMFRLQGQLPAGDPDFDLLRITAGSDFGLPSPGHTTLTRIGGGNWNVDSFFDITYRIDFVGRPGGPLSGMSGSTTGTIRMSTGQQVPPPQCVVADNGSGTVNLPPDGCDYVSPGELHKMINGLPPGTTVEIDPKHNRFLNVTHSPGGSLGGEIETFDSSLQMILSGTGGLAGYNRTVLMPQQCETHVGPRTPGQPIQSFDTEMFRMQGQLPAGDPDFDLLRITAGGGFGMPSPGHTTLTQLPGGQWAVDSFFDITYRIDFVGSPGGPFGGMSGSTTGTIRMQTGNPSVCPRIPAGLDGFPSTAMLVVEPIGPTTAAPFVVRLSSAGQPNSMVQRQAQVGDTIDTELLSLSLTGSHPLTGPVQVRESPTLASTGKIQNIVQDPSTCAFLEGDSFFDVFTEVDVSSVGETWTNNVPLHVVRKIHTLPPRDDPYENPFVDPVILYDQASGAPRARVLYERHHVDPPFPPPGDDCFTTTLDANLDSPFFPSSHVTAAGPTTVLRGAAYSTGRCEFSGVPCTSNSDCSPGEACVQAQTIDSELAQMNLVGSSPILGPVIIKLDPLASTGGLARSLQPVSTYPADSFFDVFISVDLPNQGMTLHNRPQPVPVRAFSSTGLGVRNLPPDPDTNFQSPAGVSIQLYDQANNPVGSIRDVNHRLGPPVSWEPPPPPDEYCFDSWIQIRLTLFTPFCTEDFMLPGTFRILRGGPTVPPDGRDLMRTLMANALFNGSSACVGALQLLLSPTRPSMGQIQSLAPAENFPADSFFDVFAEMNTGIGRLMTDPNNPNHMRTTINTLPPEPGETYYGPGTVINLYDSTGTTIIGQILEVDHIVHGRIPCPPNYRRRLLWSTNTHLDMLIDPATGGGAGVLSDVVRSNLQFGNPSFPLQLCFPSVGPGGVNDSVNPPRGQAFKYVAREEFDSYQGTYNEGGNQTGDRDPLVTICP